MNGDNFENALTVIDNCLVKDNKAVEKELVEILFTVVRNVQKRIKVLELAKPFVIKHLERQENRNILTPYHALLAQILYQQKDYTNGKDLYTIKYHKVHSAMTPFILQLFLYYAGCLALFNRDLSNSYFLFNQCVTMPIKEITPQCVGAWKKVTLLSLILFGRKYESRIEFKMSCYPKVKSYMKIKNSSFKPSSILKILEDRESRKELKNDGNYGLAEQTFLAAVYKNIKYVSAAFSCLTLLNLSARIEVEERMLKEIIKEIIKMKILNIEFNNDTIMFKEESVKDDQLGELIEGLKESEKIYEEVNLYITNVEEEEFEKKKKKE